MELQECDICHQEFKNLGVHKLVKHGITAAMEAGPGLELDNHIPEKQLSGVLYQIKTLLKPYGFLLSVKTTEQSGYTTDVEITARIQLRR